MKRDILITLLLMMFAIGANCQPRQRQKSEASEQLGMAIEYFSSGKYHEALLLFTRLDKQYNLNPRFHAYMGVCQYYEWNYEEACKLLSEAIPKVEGLAPHERSVYYFTCAESYFNLSKYAEAIPYYEQHLNVCYENEKADAFYRIAFCYMFTNNKPMALEYFSSALSFYEKYPNNSTARIAQLRNMIKGLREELMELEKDKTVIQEESIETQEKQAEPQEEQGVFVEE